MAWHIGNTSVRTPYRLRGALIALQGTQLNGNLQGREQEKAFASLLNQTEVVNVQRLEEDPEADASDLGRKWRVALSQLGFITHSLDEELMQSAARSIGGLSGRPFEITPNGYRLINSDPITAQQECFLRSLLAYRIPSPIENRYSYQTFNPLKFVIDIILELNSNSADAYLSYQEFTLFVQTSSPTAGIGNIVAQIIDFRNRRIENEGRLRVFYREELKAAVLREDPNVEQSKILTRSETLDSYTDLTFRYLKATGLFKNKGHGIAINPSKAETVNLIHTTPELELSDLDYLVRLWNGASLPTDEVATATQVVLNLAEQIRNRGEVVEEPVQGVDVTITRHVLEERLLQLDELEFYRNQASQTEEIAAWLEAFVNGSSRLPNGDTLRIPRGEAPAYLEWIIWRSFLAINSLVNQPWEARRFQIDQDFLPVSTAPGSGPDMVFEFQDAIVVVEVTLTASSRQEAAEGEPVRRHVAKYAETQGQTGKPVYGLFIAINIDSNTAHTFRTGDWYLRDDTKINLHIVPLSLSDFGRLFNYGQTRLGEMPALLQTILLRCRAQANQDAPAWKRTISSIIDQQIRN